MSEPMLEKLNEAERTCVDHLWQAQVLGGQPCRVLPQLRFGSLWCAKIELRTSRCEKILVMQSAKDRLGSDGVRFSAAMARIWMRVVAIGGRGIWDAWTRRHTRTRGIVVRNPVFQDGS